MVRLHQQQEHLDEPPAKAQKILCVEENRNIARLIAEELTERGFDVIVGHDGHEGFIAILKGLPELVLSEVNPPNMSGFDMLKCLKKLSPQLGKIPFIFVTALTDRKSALRVRRLRANYITKPIDFDRLEKIVKRLLARVKGPRLPILNDCEAEVLTWVVRGRTSPEIAAMLGLAEPDIAFHLGRAQDKLDVAQKWRFNSLRQCGKYGRHDA
jgi:DNA-binding response OmpR family regulator